MVKTVRVDEEQHEKLSKIQENASEYGEPTFKQLVNKSIDDLYKEVVEEDE